MSWSPRLGEHVVYSHPDMQDRVGVVLGFVTEEDRMPHRVGQPIIRWPADEPPDGPFARREPFVGVTSPHFLWPAWFGRLFQGCGCKFDEAVRLAAVRGCWS